MSSGCRGWPTNILSYVDMRVSTSRIQGRSTADTAARGQDTFGRLRVLLSSQRGHFREQDCSHLALSLYYLPFHSDQHCKGWTVRSALLSLAIIRQPARAFVSVPFSDNLLDWKRFGTRIQLPNALTSEQDPVTALRNPKSSRSQTIRLKQH